MKDGSLFWSAPKRAPKPIEFDTEDPLHISFITSFANLWAYVYNITPTNDVGHIKAVCKATKVPEFVPKNKAIETDEKAKPKEKETPEDEQNRYVSGLIEFIANNPSFPRIQSVEFEKDDDTNFHIDFINATSNLRARVYSIQEVDRLKTKRIAGRIMPAIATTTAAVSGLVSLELIKVVSGRHQLKHFKNCFLNLGLPLFQFSEPGEAAKTKVVDDIYITLWDRWDVREGDITLSALVEYFKKKFGLNVTGVFQDTTMIYVPMMPIHRKRLPQKMSQLLKNAKDRKYIDLIISFEKDGVDVIGPGVRFFF